MHFRLVGLFVLLFSGITLAAPGRSPAVEDFVGIEVEEAPATPHGSESLYNLEQDVQKIESAGKGTPATVAVAATPTVAPQFSAAPSLNLASIFGILIILGLPLISWMLVMNHMRNKASEESATNIEILEKYRQNRVESRKKSDEKSDRKVS